MSTTQVLLQFHVNNSSPTSISKFVKCPQYEAIKTELAHHIVDLYTNTLTHSEITEKQRHQSFQEKKVSQLFSGNDQRIKNF